MSAPSELSFESLAYWVVLCELAALEEADALGIASRMSYQYDWEEQAGRTGKVVAGGSPFLPVAPVQLTRGWSPLPEAVELLGPPDWESLVEPAAACAWKPLPARVFAYEGRRLRRLLAVALMRARERDLGVLVAAKPGWSYDHAHPFSEQTRRLMTAAGFAVLDRTGDQVTGR